MSQLGINFDLLTVGISVAGTGVLGFVVYFSNRKSITNKMFFVFSMITLVWGVTNYLNYQINNEFLVLWVIRFVVFFAVLQALSFFTLMFVFPKETVVFPMWFKAIVLPIASITALLTLTPFVFSSVTRISGDLVSHPLPAPGIFIFILTAVSLVIFGFVIILKKLHLAQNELRSQIKLIVTGASLMFALIILFNLVFLVVFNNTRYIPLGALFTLPFVLFTAIAILKQHLFNVKVAATSVLVFLLSIVLFLEIIYADSITLIIFRSSIFLLVLIFGINLIRSVMKEVKQREQLEALIKQRESLVHLITHKVKGSFTRTKYLFAGMLDGTFGEISPEIKKRAEQGLEFDNGGIQTVDLVLNVANMQNGIIKYDMKNVDFKDIVLKTIADKKIGAEAKGLKIETEIKPARNASGIADAGGDDIYNMMGDAIWLKEVVNNLIENSIKYTKEGTITVGLENENNKIKLSVKDNGIGINEEDKKNLFTEGGRGKDSVKVNVDSTGYGLYTVKLIVEAHKGKVWVESEGAGKGSTFFVELPTA